MNTENAKENVSIDVIIGDIKSLCKYRLLFDLLLMSLVCVLLIPILFIFKIEGVTLFFQFVFLFAILHIGYDTFVHAKILVNINNNNFKLAIDTLVEKKHIDEERYNPFKPSFNLLFDTPNIFYFSKYKKYRIPTGENYSFSQKYRMNSDGIYRQADIGDEFYLVLCNNKIIMIYNRKLFEIK